MADVGLKMKKRTPYTFAEMCKLNGITKDGEEKFQKLLDEMSYIGLLEYDYGYHYDHNGRTKEQTERRYILPMFVPGSAELFNMEELPDGSNPRLKEHPDVAEKLEADIRKNSFKLMSAQSKAAAVAAGRVVDISADDFDDEDK